VNLVSGRYPAFAIDSGLPVRLAVHETSYGQWIVDHFDTGLCFGYPQISKAAAVAHGVSEIRRGLESGDYNKVICEFNRATEDAA